MKILVLGDAFIDRYWLGTTNRVSPEAPVAVVKVTNKYDIGGGAANVAANFNSLGADCLLVHGRMQADTLIVKNRLMVGDTQVARWDEHDFCQSIDVTNIAEALKQSPDAVTISDYGKGSITEEVLDAVKSAWLPTFVDTKKDPKEWVHIAQAVFPNVSEYKQYKGSYDEFGLVVLKRSEHGAELLKYGKIAGSAKSTARFVTTVNGAGDTVLAAFVFEWLRRKQRAAISTDVQVLEFAMKVAGRAVEKPLTSAVGLAEVEAVEGLEAPQEAEPVEVKAKEYLN